MHSIYKIGERFWYITPISETDRPILGMVTGDKKTLMLDAGNSEEHARYFLEELSKRNIQKPDLIALTHWHWDHIFGLSALAGSVSISSKQTKEAMEKLIHYSWKDEALDQRVKEGTEIEFCASAIKKEYPEHRDIKIVLPDITFEGQLEIDLGGVTCVLKHVGGNHAADAVVIFVKEEKILFLGDCIYPDIFSKKQNYTIKETIELLDQLEEFDAETYVLSHWKSISKLEFTQEVTMLRSIARYTDLFQGNHRQIVSEYRKQVGRELTEDELLTIDDFVNGWD